MAVEEDRAVCAPDVAGAVARRAVVAVVLVGGTATRISSEGSRVELGYLPAVEFPRNGMPDGWVGYQKSGRQRGANEGETVTRADAPKNRYREDKDQGRYVGENAKDISACIQPLSQ